jgi:hypothetical protein
MPPPLGRGHNHVDLAAVSPGADEPVFPIDHRYGGALAGSRLGENLARLDTDALCTTRLWIWIEQDSDGHCSSDLLRCHA